MFLNSKYHIILKYLFLLLPLTIITGPFLSDLNLCLISLIFLIYSVHKKRFDLYKNKFSFLFLIFYTFLIISSSISIDPYFSLIENEGAIFFFRYFFFIIAISYLIKEDRELLILLFKIYIIVVTLVMIDGFYQWITGYNIFGFPRYSPTRITGVFYLEPIIGNYVVKSFFIIFSVYQLKIDHLKNFKFIVYILAFFSLIFVFISGERSAFLSYTLFAIFFILLNFNKKIILFCSVVIISLILFSKNSERVQYRVNETINQVSQTTIPFMPYSPRHEEHFITAIKIFKEKPVIGGGANLFRKLCKFEKYKYKNSCNSHPHNYHLQLLSEFGLLGYSLFLFLFLNSFSSLLKILINNFTHKKKHYFNKNYLIIISTFVIFWPITTNMNFYNNWLNVLVAIILGIYYFSIKELEEHNK